MSCRWGGDLRFCTQVCQVPFLLVASHEDCTRTVEIMNAHKLAASRAPRGGGRAFIIACAMLERGLQSPCPIGSARNKPHLHASSAKSGGVRSQRNAPLQCSCHMATRCRSHTTHSNGPGTLHALPQTTFILLPHTPSCNWREVEIWVWKKLVRHERV